MKILSVTVRHLRSSEERFGHKAVEATAEVEPGETPDQAHDRLDSWVQAKLHPPHSVDDMERQKQNLDWAIRQLQSSTKDLESRKARLQQEVGALQMEVNQRQAERDRLVNVLGLKIE